MDKIIFLLSIHQSLLMFISHLVTRITNFLLHKVITLGQQYFSVPIKLHTTNCLNTNSRQMENNFRNTQLQHL